MTRVTLKDIARATGLTVNTVSHALRDKEDISDATKRKVKKAASEMGYVPNTVAASLRSGRTKIIGIVYDNLLNPYYSIMTNYLDAALTRNGYSYISFVEKGNAGITADTVDRLVQRSVDGIISFLEPDEETVELFSRSVSIPLLIVGRRPKFKHIDYICTDDREGGRLLTEHLYSRGYRKIAYFADTLAISPAAERMEGYRSVMAKYGLTETVKLVEGKTYTEAVTELLAESAPDSAVCFNDMIAFEMLYALRNCGRTDIAVVGYDYLQNELKIPGQITTVGYDKAQIADVAAEVLMYKIDKGYGTTRFFEKVHGVTLIEGETAPYKTGV